MRAVLHFNKFFRTFPMQPLLFGILVGHVTLKEEVFAQFALLWPMFVSYAARFAMATTDAAFVGHLQTAEFTSADYLTAAVLSYVVTSMFCAVPLALDNGYPVIDR
jgi:Na+-driven multidrug efflux pump